MIRRSKSISLTLVLAIVLVVFGCNKEGETDLSQLSVEDLTYQLLPSGARIVSGIVYNPTEDTIGSVQLQVSLFDKDNVRVDGLSILIRDLEAGSRVAFREPVNSDFDVTAARVKGMIKL